MANRLMFEVGVSDSVQNLDKLKKELDKFIQHYSKDTAIKLKVDIENLQAVTSALSKIGDTPQLRNLRQEIESINKEFSKLAVGAGGVGDLGVRKMNQEVEDLKQKWDSAVRLMARYNQELELARRNRDRETNLTDRQTYTDQINKLKENIKTQQEVINSAKSAYDNAVKNAGQLVDVNTRAEASFREVKRSIDEMKQSMSSMNVNVNIGQDFAKWTSEVQAVSASVRELVEQLQKVVNTNGMQAVATSAQATANAVKYTTEEIEKQQGIVKKYEDLLASRTKWVSNEREHISLQYDGLNIDGQKRLLDIEKERAQVLEQIKKKEQEISEVRQRLTKRGDTGINSDEKAILKSYEKMYQFIQKMNAEYDKYYTKSPVREDTVYSLRNVFKELSSSNIISSMDKVSDFIAFLKDEIRRLGSNVDTSGMQTLLNQANEVYSVYLKLNKEQAKALENRSLTNVTDAYRNIQKDQTFVGALYAKDSNLQEEARVLKFHLDRETESLKEQANASQNLAQAKQKLNEMQMANAQATEKAAQATTQLVQAEQKGTTQGNLFDPQKFNTLQEAIDKIIAEINRLQQAFTHLGQNNSLSNLSTMINGLAVTLSSLSNAIKVQPVDEQVKKLQSDLESAQSTITSLTEKLNNLAVAQKNVAETASKTGKSEQQIGDSLVAMFNRYNKLLADIQNIKREIVEVQRGTGGGGPFGDKLSEYFSAINQIRNAVRDITSSSSLADAINKGMSSEMLAKLTSALSALKTNYKEVIADAKDFNKATDKGSSQAEARIRKLGMAFNELKNYMKANGGSEEMKRLQSEIQGAIQKMRQLMNAGKFGEAINVYERLSGIIRQAATATKEFERAQQSVTSAVSHTNSQLQSQSQILGDLKMMAYQYLSVWGAQQFIHNIIELGGQLEQQRLSIGAILQDTAQANHLFSQIKDLAIKSPFGVQQLDAMSKQLSAYGFQYSELYEWTKRLADISAATGTSVDRLALALGHVRSEGALSGYTLRQFSMGNIPLLQKLSENLGKTKQEIRKMTRNKEIGYEDVLEVLKQLTDESGMFYQAQETMAQALNAKFKNLRDSFQIMYSEMAEGAPGDFLKGFATTMTDLSRQWQVLLPMIGAAGAMWAMNKASAALVNVELAKMATLTNANTLASSKYSVAQLRQIANWEKMPHAMVRARLALQGFRTSLLSLGKMIFSWPTAIFAAIEALTYMWAKQSRESEKAKEMTEVLTNTALESQKNIKKQLENISPYEKGMSDSEMKTGIESMTESIKNYGVNAQEVLEKVYGKDAEGRVMSMADRYKTLREELEKTAKVYKEMQRTSSGWEFGIEYTDGGWFDDDIQTDLTNYANAVKEYDDAFTTMTANYASAVNKALEQVKKASPEFKRIADGLNSDAERVKWLYENQGQYGGIYNMFKGALHREDANAGGGVLGYQLGDNLRKAEREAMKELDEFFVGIEAKYKEYGYNFTEDGKYLSEVQVGNLLRQSKEWLEKHPEWERIYDVIWDKLNKRWGLPIVPDVTPVEEELPQWLEDFQKELDKEKTGITLTANMSMEQIVDEMKKAYDQAQTTINKLGPVAMTAKINVVGMSDENLEAYNNPLSPNYNPEMYNWLKQLKGAYTKRDIVDNAAKKRGLKLEGMKKDGTHKAEKQNQENAKAVREQVRVIKEAADAFQYWREKVGDKGAWEHVKSEFGDVLNKIGITADNIEDVRGHLKRIPEMKEYKAITDKKVKTEIKKETAKEEDQYKRKDFERDTERFLSKTQIQLDNLTRRWDMFNSVREATGDVKLAIELSGADYAEGQTRNLADSVKQKIEEEFAAVGAVHIPFDIYLSDKEIEDSIKAAMPQANETQIKAFVEDYKKWRDLQRDVLKTDVKTFTQIIGSSQDYATQLQKITTEYDKQKESLDALLKLYNSGQVDENGNRRGINADQYLKAMQQIDADMDLKVLKLSDQYAMFMAGSFGVMRDNVVETAKLIESKLNKAMKAGVIDVKTYADEMRKVRDLMDKYQEDSFFGKESPFVAFMNGGLKGSNDYVKNAIQALESKKEPLTAAEIKQLEALKKLQNTLSQTIGTLSSFSMVLSIAQGVVDGFSSAAQSLSEMFDALGKEGAANFWSDVSDSIKAGSSFLQPVNNILQNAMSGNVSGVLSSAISAPVDMITGPIKGFAQLHDKKRERQLEALRREVQQIDNTLKLIKSLRERSLGYDNGNLRRQMAQLYSNNTNTVNTILGKVTVNDAAGEAMKEYYSRGGIRGNGYTQELEALKKQREDYQKMYDAENDKKKSSAEALEEYKVKMAELDEQIMYYIEDLSKELWGIDFQSWADQISDALWTAFENGESAVEAFHDTAKDIIADVAKKMMNIHLIEPLFNQLEQMLFGTYNSTTGRYSGGAIKYDSNGNIDMQGSEPEVLRILGQFFGEGGSMEKNVEAAEQFYDWVQEITGLDFSSDDSKSTGTSIKSITEETADLLASYLNATRASVAKIEGMQAQYLPLYYDVMTRGNTSLTNIENHTAAIMRSNDAIQRAVDDLYRDFHGLRTSAWKIPIA